MATVPQKRHAESDCLTDFLWFVHDLLLSIPRIARCLEQPDFVDVPQPILLKHLLHDVRVVHALPANPNLAAGRARHVQRFGRLSFGMQVTLHSKWRIIRFKLWFFFPLVLVIIPATFEMSPILQGLQYGFVGW